MPSLLARRRRWWVALGLVLVTALVVGLTLWPAHDTSTPGVTPGPTGSAFYEPGARQVTEGEHGTLIWSRRVVDGPTIGGTTHLVLYRSTSAKGETVPVSGVVSVPEGTPPEDGWPVVSWGHGTTGMADECAPSRSMVDEQTGVYTASMDEVTSGLVERGYAVVRTDYEGLGPPGPHPYLMGQSSGAAMTDLVIAARELEPSLSTRWVAMGHSQGGQAALFTSRFTGAYSPGLDLQGIVAMAPPSQLRAVVGMVDGGPASQEERRAAAGESGSTATFLGPLLVSAARTADVPVEDVVSPQGRELLPQLERRCIAELFADDSLGGITLEDFVAEDADLSRIRRTVAANDAAELHPEVPVLLVQGGDDTTVPPLLTDRLVGQYERQGAEVEHVTLPGEDHISTIDEAAPTVRAWVGEALGG